MTAEALDLSPAETVRSAHQLLHGGRSDEALLLLQSVHSECEMYASYYIVLGECLLALGNTLGAREALQHALRLSPNSARPAILLESFDQPEEPEKSNAKSHGAPELTLAALFDTETRTPLATGGIHRTEPRQAPDERQSGAFDLAHVATMLSRDRPMVRPVAIGSLEAESKQQREHAEPQVRDSKLVSETLAGILLGQGKFDEALRAYRQLRREEPKRQAYFDERIALIEERLRSGSSAART